MPKTTAIAEITGVAEETVVEAQETLVQDAVETHAEAPDTFPVVGRMNVRGDGESQSRYNLLVLDGEAVANLDALGEEFGFVARNANGDVWLDVGMDARSRRVLTTGGKGSTALVIEGTVTIVDVKAGRPMGQLVVKAARPASLRDGGRVVEKNENAAPRTRESGIGTRRRG